MPLLLNLVKYLTPAQNHQFWRGAILLAYFAGTAAFILFGLWDRWRPLLQIKQLPKPEITLDLNLRSPDHLRRLE